jgi:hypothetical protein
VKQKKKEEAYIKECVKEKSSFENHPESSCSERYRN